MQSSTRLSRRQFLIACGTVGATAALIACAPAAAPAGGGEAASSSDSAAPANEAQGISFLIRTDIRSAYAGDAAAEAWNKEHEQKITLDEPAGDVQAKIQAAQAAGDLVWDGFAVIEGPWSIQSWVTRNMIQPLDDLIAASTIANADKVVPAIIPSVLESSKYEGKQYTIPGNVGSVALGWFIDPLQKAGVEPPSTWDEVRAAAEAVKASDDKLTPYDVACSPLCDMMSMIWGATATPITADGLVDWQGEASIAALKWFQEMVKDKLMPGTHAESFGNWLKGGTAIMSSFDVHGTLAQQTFGVDKASTGINIRRKKEDPAAGAPFWLNGSVILNGAANPQGMADFYLWWFGPDNKANGEQIATVAAKPAYQYTYDEFIKPEAVQQWQLEGIELVRNSVPFPSNLLFGVQGSVMGPWIEKAVNPDNNLTAEDAIAQAMEELKTEIEDMKQSGSLPESCCVHV